jgi:tRNA threonylcarbamoyladenosine biosynthesis protein TsaB
VAPVSSLAVIAEAGLEAIHAAGEGSPQAAVVAMDARLGEVFTARFLVPAGSSVTAASPERLEAPAAAAERIRAGDALLGNGFERCPTLAALLDGERPGRVSVLPTAPALLRLARRWLEDNPGLPPEQAQPVYLREQVADKPAES